MLETDALKEKLEMELHRFARPPEELSSGDPYFEQLQTMLAIRDELINIPLCDIQRKDVYKRQARWMTDSEKDKAFDSYILDPHDPTIRQLLETGYDGLDFLKEK